jgi:hypothetical protein
VYTYQVTVVNGTDAKGPAYAPGEKVTLVSNPAGSNRKFTHWTVKGFPELDGSTETTLEFTMPDGAVKATANYVDISTSEPPPSTDDSSSNSRSSNSRITITDNDVPLAVIKGYIDSFLTSKTTLTLPDLSAMDEAYRSINSISDAWWLVESNTDTRMTLPKTPEEIAGTFTGEPPRLVAAQVADDLLAAFPVPEGQEIWGSIDMTLARGDEPYTPESLEGTTLSFALLRTITEADNMLIWWQDASGAWVSMPCPPNDENLILFAPAPTMGAFIITINQ